MKVETLSRLLNIMVAYSLYRPSTVLGAGHRGMNKEPDLRELSF